MPQRRWTPEPPCSEPKIHRLVELVAVELPPEYLAFLRKSDGAEGEVGLDPPGWAMLWGSGQVAPLNAGYNVAQHASGLLGFGSDGAGEMLAFDTRHGRPWPIVIVPFIPLGAEHAARIASDFDSFRRTFGVRGRS